MNSNSKDHGSGHGHGGSLAMLALGAMGVVYGDIGTSPLYTWNETLFGHHPLGVDEVNVLGVASLIFWTIFIVVSLKYILFVLNEDHEGEGGTFALLANIRGIKKTGITAGVGLLLVFAGGLLYGEGIITPPISVLAAVEGLVVINKDMFAPLVIPLTLAILVGLFSFQYLGTAKVGTVFGVITAVWFAAIAGIGIYNILQAPQILQAVDPRYGFNFLAHHGPAGMIKILGSVVLCMTGGEALFADLGHFGKKAIRLTWLAYVWPCLLLQYFGQGAFLLSGGEVLNNNVFYSAVPTALRLPMIPLATAATVIASQALISGAFSLTRTAIALGLIPRLKIYHTSTDTEGQIYIPFVNWSLLVACCILVVVFKSSSNLAAAYGLAVTGVMTTTCITMVVLKTQKRGWPLYLALVVFGLFGVVDIAYLTANAVKFVDGGYIPFTIGLIFFAIMLLWQWGRTAVSAAYQRFATKEVSWYVGLREKLDDIKATVDEGLEFAVALVTGTRRMVELDRCVVFLTSRSVQSGKDRLPTSVRVFLKRLGAMPAHTVFLHIQQIPRPHRGSNWLHVSKLHGSVIGVSAEFGYMEDPNVDEVLLDLRARGLLPVDPAQVAIETGEDDLLIRDDAPWRVSLLARAYRTLMKCAISAHAFFGLRSDARVGRQVIPVTVDSEGFEVFLPEFAVGGSVELTKEAPATV